MTHRPSAKRGGAPFPVANEPLSVDREEVRIVVEFHEPVGLVKIVLFDPDPGPEHLLPDVPDLRFLRCPIFA